MRKKLNFFKQPARGFDENSRGRTDEQIAEFEAKAGFKLPAAYCELMRLQNGGSVQYQKIVGVEDFSFGGGFSALRPELACHVTNFRDYILLTCDEQELAATQKELSPFYPERLVLFSGLDGHGGAFFDYGYRQHNVVADPSVVFVDDDGDDFLHFSETGPKFVSFEEFLDNLVVDSESDDSFYLGIVGKDTYEITVQQLTDEFGLNLKTYIEDDRNGHYDFHVWHSGYLPLELGNETIQQYANQNGTTLNEILDWTSSEGKVRNIYTVICPNQHRSGTYLYQDNPELTVILEIRRSWFPMKTPIEGLIAKLRKMEKIKDVIYLI